MTAGVRRRKAGRRKTLSSLPRFCDYDCRYASFAPKDATGACLREQAVYCSLFQTYNAKNSRCLETKRAG